MTTFDKREEGFEKKFAVDEELRFKAEARRNKLLGLWAASLLGKSGEAAAAYARDVVAADFDGARRRCRSARSRPISTPAALPSRQPSSERRSTS